MVILSEQIFNEGTPKEFSVTKKVTSEPSDNGYVDLYLTAVDGEEEVESVISLSCLDIVEIAKCFGCRVVKGLE